MISGFIGLQVASSILAASGFCYSENHMRVNTSKNTPVMVPMTNKQHWFQQQQQQQQIQVNYYLVFQKHEIDLYLLLSFNIFFVLEINIFSSYKYVFPSLLFFFLFNPGLISF